MGEHDSSGMLREEGRNVVPAFWRWWHSPGGQDQAGYAVALSTPHLEISKRVKEEGQGGSRECCWHVAVCTGSANCQKLPAIQSCGTSSMFKFPLLPCPSCRQCHRGPLLLIWFDFHDLLSFYWCIDLISVFGGIICSSWVGLRMCSRGMRERWGCSNQCFFCRGTTPCLGQHIQW